MRPAKPTMTETAAGNWRLDNAILAYANSQPDRIALSFGAAGISYAALAIQVDDAARRLANHLTCGDRFAVYSMNHPNSFVLLLAAARIGAVMVPLNWRLSAAELRYQLDDCAPKLIIYGAEFADNLAVIAGDDAPYGTVPIDELAAIGTPALIDDSNRTVTIDDALLIVYTSGTTGRPKGAVLSQRAMRSNAVMSQHAFGLSAADIVLNILPLFHVGGLNIQPVPALLAGAQIIIEKTFDPHAVLNSIATRGVTHVTTVPTMLGALLGCDEWAETDLSSLRMMAIGSTDVPVTMINAVQDRGIALVQIYGATETAPIAIYQTADMAFDSVGSIGRAGSDCAIRLVDANGADVETGIVGEIWVKGDNILSHYWNNLGESATHITDGWFHTGDMARCDDEGLYWFADRLKHVIISGGENIYPAELERVLTGHPDLAEFSIVGRDDSRWGQVPIVVAVRRTLDDTTIDAARIMTAFDGEVAKFKRPKDVVFVEALPRNALGKIVTDKVTLLAAEASN